MGLFDRIKDAASKQRQPSPSGSDAFVRNYVNEDRFKGMKRMHVTIYGDASATKNATKILNGEHLCNCVGRQITLTGFTYDGGSGIKVSVDGQYIGIVWSRDDDKIYAAAWAGNIKGVFVRIEWSVDDRPEANLFVRLAE